MAFCALCTSDIGPFLRLPLGRGGALVDVCGPCETEHPREGRYSFGGGDVAQVPRFGAGARAGTRGTKR